MKKLYLNKAILYIGIVVLMIALSSCAKAVPELNFSSDEPYGFWSGLWHGIIAPISFFISLFDSDVALYGVNNNGGWYDFGFVIGAGILFGGGSRAKKCR